MKILIAIDGSKFSEAAVQTVSSKRIRKVRKLKYYMSWNHLRCW